MASYGNRFWPIPIYMAASARHGLNVGESSIAPDLPGDLLWITHLQPVDHGYIEQWERGDKG